ncbi:MAG TPA: hypothetical protein VGH66_06215, partial [Acidimicrobiales bacterium]
MGARPDRGSPMLEQPSEHSITMLRPSGCYRYIYPPGYNLRRVSYFFEHRVADILPDGAYDECQELVDGWRQRWDQPTRSSLRYLKTWDSVSIHDRRGPEPKPIAMTTTGPPFTSWPPTPLTPGSCRASSTATGHGGTAPWT